MFRLLFSKTKRFGKLDNKVTSELHYLYNPFELPFKSAFGCFKFAVVYLSCVWLFLLFDSFHVLIWPFLLMAIWQPCFYGMFVSTHT